MQDLPGIGKYTAHAVASFAFDQPTPIVEANTARVLTRVFDFQKRIDSGAARKTLWRYAAVLVPKSNARAYNSALIDLGALVCVAHQPKCGICPVKKFCGAKNPQLLPVRKSPAPIKRLIEKHAFVLRGGKILLEQSSSRWRGMWILPPVKCRSRKNSSLKHPVYTAIFPFTHHRVTLRVYRHGSHEAARKHQRWFPIRSLESIPIASPHSRALRALTAAVSE
jgi:A/G-specific adenine glycosylase